MHISDRHSWFYHDVMMGSLARPSMVGPVYVVCNPIDPRYGARAASTVCADSYQCAAGVDTLNGEVELARRRFPESIVVQAWSQDGQYVLFTTLRTDSPPPHDLWRVSVREGRPERLGPIASPMSARAAFTPPGAVPRFKARRSGLSRN